MLLRFSVLLVGLVLIQGRLSAAEASGSTNVLLICIDDLKPNLGCYGDSVAKTPAIDSLARRGLRFDAAYCNQAVCAPSRNALMTGLRPDTIGIYDLQTNFRFGAPDAVTLGQYFMERGYASISLGKIYHRGHGNSPDEASFSEPPWFAKRPAYVNRESIRLRKKDATGKVRGPATEIGQAEDQDYADGHTANEACRRLEEFAEQANQPFFLGVGFIRPHLPFVAPKKYWDLYDATGLPMPEYTKAPKGAPSFAKTNGGELKNYTDIDVLPSGADDETRHLIHGYYAATSYMDAQVGRVLKKLDETGLANNTVVVLWGDHGWHLGDHGMWCKHTNYEQATRIPLIVALPVQDRTSSSIGKSTKSLVETVDIYPTLCELTGGEIPDGLDGKSFRPILDDHTQTVRPTIRHVYPRSRNLGIATRDERYRLVQWTPMRGGDPVAVELYDYEADPLETQNLANELPQEVERLAAIANEYPPHRPKVTAQGTTRPVRSP
ncbi:MAG: sulfatase [Planctomycetota bacterium]